MTELITNLGLWFLTHGQTCIALALAFLLGGVWGMWIQYDSQEKQKDAHHTAM